jgi:hypothetical protein
MVTTPSAVSNCGETALAPAPNATRLEQIGEPAAQRAAADRSAKFPLELRERYTGREPQNDILDSLELALGDSLGHGLGGYGAIRIYLARNCITYCL